MTLKQSMFLKRLKKAQIYEDGCVYVDFDNMTATTVHDATEKYITVSLKKYGSSIRSTLHHLSAEGWVEKNDFGYVKVNSNGWHAFELKVQDAIKFTVRDILVPVIVSIITVILTELAIKHT